WSSLAWRIAVVCLATPLEMLVDRVEHSRSVLDLVQAIGLAGAVTYAWLAGVDRLRLGATVSGFISGVASAVVMTAVTWVLRGGHMYDARAGVLVAKAWPNMLDTALGSGLFLWGLTLVFHCRRSLSCTIGKESR